MHLFLVVHDAHGVLDLVTRDVMGYLQGHVFTPHISLKRIQLW